MAQDVTWSTSMANDLILTEYNEITTLLRKPVKDKRRIRYTCFDVSSNYIALGSTSGSIYLFVRSTCSFQQLIPLSYGAVTHILISPDEKVIALSTIDENACIVVFKPTVKEAMISSKSERNSESITALCWNDNSSELYIGDANGTVHVMGLSMFTVKRGIFQDPACPIMGLDYKVVQMDFCSPLLLVSTISNCYLCNTIEGQYEKVGLRTRQGEFGACFYKPCIRKETDISAIQPKHLTLNNAEFKAVQSSDSDVQYPRIYCARPGSRLWEANPNGKIVKTHNFKEALAIPPFAIHKPRELRTSCIESSETNWSPQSLKFSPLHIIAGKYLFTYNSNALYILDAVNSAVILWNNEYANIAIANVIDNHIYLMTNSGDFHCLELISTNLPTPNQNTSFSEINSGIVVVSKKNIELKKDIKNEDVSNVEKKNESSDNLLPKLDEEVTKSEVEILNKQNLIDDSDEKEEIKFSDKTSPDVAYIDIDMDKKRDNHLKQKSIESEIVTTEEKANASKDEIRNLISEVQIIYTLTNSINDSMSDNEIDMILQALQRTLDAVKKSYENLIQPKPNVFKAIETAEQYYRNIFLSKLNKDQLSTIQNDNILNEILSCFLAINEVNNIECDCGFPHPIKEIREPKFLEIGTAILQRYLENRKNICINLCEKVPYMWRIYLTMDSKQEDFFDDRTFAQCLQTRDEFILSFILLELNTKQWEFVKKAITNLKLKQCIFCSQSINLIDNQNEFTINWSNVANEIMKRKGPDIAVTFLMKLVIILPSVSLNKSLFQSLIFTKILNSQGFEQPVDFNQKLNRPSSDKYSSLCCPKIQNQLLQTLEKDLNRPVSKHVFGTQAHHWGMRHEPSNSICPCCTLPLQTPVLLDNNGLSLFPCGHSYHVNCLIQKKILKCNLHP